MAFTEKLDDEAMAFFTKVAQQPFSQQAVAFLNAYWPEVNSQAEFIFSVAFETFVKADMHAKGVQLVHKYDEGTDVDFDIGLYFYEQLNKFLDTPANKEWKGEQFAVSQPTMMTALKRKQELRDKVDVNFDGRVSFLEYLLYQYQGVANPADFVTRSMAGGDEHPEIRKAREALEAVTAAIREFEAEKYRLEQESQGEGVKALRAKNMLAQLMNSPLAETLQTALIKAEAALRRAKKMFANADPNDAGAQGPSAGAMWWMERDLAEKKKRYGPRK